jgi:hypothetical protein
MTKRNQENEYPNISYEHELLAWISELDRYLVSAKITYALFGGGAVAGYIGQLPRKLHDLDLIVFPDQINALIDFLSQNGFLETKSYKSDKANFRKFTAERHIYQIITSIFPAEFKLLNFDDRRLPVLGTHDFSAAIRNSTRKKINSVDTRTSVEVSVIPLEELIFSKLWPAFESNTVHDLLLLLACSAANDLDVFSIEQHFRNSPLAHLSLETFERFCNVYQKTAWYGLTRESGKVDDTINHLTSVLMRVHEPGESMIPRGSNGSR